MMAGRTRGTLMITFLRRSDTKISFNSVLGSTCGCKVRRNRKNEGSGHQGGDWPFPVRLLYSIDDGSQPPLGDLRPPDGIRHRQNLFQGFGVKAKKAHDVGHSGTTDSLPPSDLGLVSDLADVELALPLDGLSEEFGDVGGSWGRRLLEIAPGQRDDAHDLVGVYPSRQDADTAVFRDPHRAEGDLHLLFAVGRKGGAILAVNGGVDYSEPDLGPCGTRSVSRARHTTIFRLATP